MTDRKCICSNCDRPAFCKSAWCAHCALGAKSKHRPDIDAWVNGTVHRWIPCICERRKRRGAHRASEAAC